MPITKSAKKVAISSLKKRESNQSRRKNYKSAVKDARVEGSTKLSAAFKALDKAAKTGTIHRNKASRLKSRLSKAVANSK